MKNHLICLMLVVCLATLMTQLMAETGKKERLAIAPFTVTKSLESAKESLRNALLEHAKKSKKYQLVSSDGDKFDNLRKKADVLLLLSAYEFPNHTYVFVAVLMDLQHPVNNQFHVKDSFVIKRSGTGEILFEIIDRLWAKIEPASSAGTMVELKIEGMKTASEVDKVRSILKKCKGVKIVRVYFDDKSATVTGDPKFLKTEELIKAFESSKQYTVTVAQ